MLEGIEESNILQGGFVQISKIVMARPSLEYPGLSQVGRHKGVCEVAWDQVEPDSPVSVWKALGLMDCHLQSAVQKQPFRGVPPLIIRAWNYLFLLPKAKADVVLLFTRPK